MARRAIKLPSLNQDRKKLGKRIARAQSISSDSKAASIAFPIASPTDFQYFNVHLYNDPLSGVGPIPAIIEQSYAAPFIDRCSDFQVNVDRFKIPTGNIPIFIWPDDVFPAFPTPVVPPPFPAPQIIYPPPATGTYWVTLQYNRPPAAPKNYSYPLIYINPATYTPPSAGPPATTSWIGQISTNPVLVDINGVNRYGVWKILDFLEMLYAAMWLATQNMFSDNAGHPIPTAGNLPFVDYNYAGASNIISIGIPVDWTQGGGLVPHADYVRVFFNYELSQFLPNLRSSLYSQIPSQAPTLDYEIQLRSSYQSGTFIIIPQELPTYSTWSDFQSVVFVSNTIPINPESSASSEDTDTGRNVLFALTDFEALTPVNPNSYIVFTQLGPRRYVDLRSDGPLYKVNVQAYWTNKTGYLFPVYIPPSQIFSMKMIFRRKTASAST